MINGEWVIGNGKGERQLQRHEDTGRQREKDFMVLFILFFDLGRAIQVGVIEGGRIIKRLEMGEDGDIGQGLTNSSFDLFKQMMTLQDGPGIWDEDVKGNEATRTGLSCAQGMILNALGCVRIKHSEDGSTFFFR